MYGRIIGSVALTALAACAITNEGVTDRSSSSATGVSDGEKKPAEERCVTSIEIGSGFDSSRSGVWLNDINERGDVVGFALFADSSFHAFVWSGGEMKDLGTLGGRESEAVAINERGDIAGSAQSTGSDRPHAVRWRDGVIEDLGTLGGGWSDATDIDELGNVVGYAEVASTSSRAFYWSDGTMTNLGTFPGGRDSLAARLNDRGQVLGYAETSSGVLRAVVWENGVMRDLGTTSNNGHDLNAAGEAIFGNGSRAYFWRDGATTEILPPGAVTPIDANDLNDRGEVVVSARNDDGRDVAFVWRDGTSVPISTGGSPGYVQATAINGKGEVVGFAAGSAGGRAFFWKDGEITWLAPDNVNSSATALNDRGQVIGHIGSTAMLWEIGPCSGGGGDKDAGSGGNDAGSGPKDAGANDHDAGSSSGGKTW